MKKKVLYEINSKEELEAIVYKAIENALEKTNSKKAEIEDVLLTTEELCLFLKLSRVSIWNLTKRGILPFLRVGNQKRYQKSEVINSLLKNKELKSINYGE
jgi:excisionase family DNA binding protein